MNSDTKILRCAIYTRVSTDYGWNGSSILSMQNAKLPKPM
jgi:hypothetical protein